MSEHPHSSESQLLQREKADRRPRFDLSTIMGIEVSKVDVPQEAEAMARDYLDGLR